ncbi:MAG TPA: hypothetical protein VGC56_07160 [Allosphingosinicella sp.]|jgi:hypothetical protein
MADFTFISGESFNGAVARWADEVGDVERMIEITSHAGVVYNHRQDAPSASPEQIEALALAMGVDARELHARAMPRTAPDPISRYDRHMFNGVAVPTFLIEKRVRRYSPCGLSNSLADPDIGRAYDRAAWHIRVFPYCSETWETLLDRCPYCEKHPGWRHTLGIDRCEHCMTDLKTARGDIIPEELRSSLTAAVGLLDHLPERRAASLALLPERISRMGPALALDVLVNLLPVIDTALPTDPAILFFKTRPMQICHAVAGAWQMMVGWPGSLTTFASDHVATRTAKHSDGNVGRTIRFLTPRRNAGTSPELDELIAEWRTEVDIDGPNGPAILERTRCITAACNVTGLGTAEVSDLRRRKALPSVFVIHKGRPEPRFPVEAFEIISELLAVRMPIDRARLAVGVSCNGIEQLVAMRLLEREEHPYITARYAAMQIVASSLDDLVARLAAEACGDPKVCNLPLHSAMKAVGGRLKPWGPAFRALIDNSLHLDERLDFVLAPGVAPLSRRVLIARTDIEQLRALTFDPADPAHKQIVYADTMSKCDAAEVLNVGSHQSTALLGAITTRAGTREKLVPVPYVLDLAKTHISAAEIGMRRGIPPHSAWREAKAKKVLNLGPGGLCRSDAEKKIFCSDLAFLKQPDRHRAVPQLSQPSAPLRSRLFQRHRPIADR